MSIEVVSDFNDAKHTLTVIVPYHIDHWLPSLFADKVIRHNPLLPGLPIHALPALNHGRTDHNTKPMAMA